MNEQEKNSGQTEAKPSEAGSFKQQEQALMEMGKALRATSIYPSGHPQRANLLRLAYESIKGVLTVVGGLSFNVTRACFIFKENKIAEKLPMVAELAKEMHLRQVKSFSLRRELSLEDLTSFLEMLLEDPENFRKGRFIEQWVKGRKIQTVWVNEMDFSRLVTASGALDDEQPEDDPASPEAQLEEILVLLEKERDPERFGQLLRELEIFLRPIIEQKQYDAAWKVIRTISLYAGSSKPGGAAGEQIAALVNRSLGAMLKGGFLASLFNMHSEKEGPARESVENVLQLLGPAVVGDAVTFMSVKESVSMYRPLMDFVIGLGGKARPILEGFLKDDNLIRVRKSTYLLGEIRSRESVLAIKALLDHKDDKVRRDAIRALVRIRGMESIRALASALQNEKEPEMKIVIVSALGEARDLAGVPVLIKMLSSEARRDDTVPLLEAVIEALGRIGSREALPSLIRVLNKWTVFNRESAQRLRIKAAEALGRLGGESAMQALARYARGGDAPLQRTCTLVLEALLKNNGQPVPDIEEYLK